MSKSLAQQEEDLRKQKDRIDKRLKEIEDKNEAFRKAEVTHQLLGIGRAICTASNARKYGIDRTELYSATTDYLTFAAELMGLGAFVLMDNDYGRFEKTMKAIRERAESITPPRQTEARGAGGEIPSPAKEPSTKGPKAGEDPTYLSAGTDARGSLDLFSITSLGMFEGETCLDAKSKKTE